MARPEDYKKEEAALEGQAPVREPAAEGAPEEKQAEPAYELHPVAPSPAPMPPPPPETGSARAAFGQQRKKRGRRLVVVLVIIAVVVALIVFFALRGAMQGPTPTYAEFHEVARGDVRQSLATSGVLTTGEKKTVYSTASAPLTGVYAQLGQRVNEGEQLFAFDLTELQRAYDQAVATAHLTDLQSQTSLDASNKSQEKVNDANNAINELAGRQNAVQEQMNELSARVAAIEADYAARGINLTAMESELALLKMDYAAAPTPALKVQITALETQLAALQAPLQQASSALAASGEDVAYIEGEITQLEASREAAEAAILDGNGRAQIAAQGAVNQYPVDAAAEALEAARQGIPAPMTGVVSSLSAESGSLASQYTPLCIIESLDKVDVIVSLSRYDLERVQEGQAAVVTSLGKEYEGVVSKIDAMANLNMAAASATADAAAAGGGSSGGSSFVNATISITKPDADIKLGLEANVEITTGAASDVITAPIGAVNTDVEGTYCFVAEEGVAVRRDITLGLSSDTEVEIVEGLAPGDQLILSSQNLLPGMAVSDDPAYRSTQDLMSMMVG